MAEAIVRSVPGTAFRQEITVAGHALHADEPVSAGGTNAGPGPYELVLAALGSCKSMTVSMYARRKSWPLEKVTVRLRHDRVHAEDCADCETKEGFVDRIDVEMLLEGKLDASQRARLLEIADKCPVHKTLTSEIRIGTREISKL